MHVLATAGHVDHGKSTLVRALTGMEPDRWSSERERGLSIDLGFVWTTLPSGADLAIVDVPGHERFVANMLAGVAAVPAVLFVVAADGGWSQQSEEHLLALDALGITRGLLVITRCDLADPAEALMTAQARLSKSSLAGIGSVAVSPVTGAGMPELRAAIDALLANLPKPDCDADVRLWVDRSFTVRGRGTVVTATLAAGRLAVGDRLELAGSSALLEVRGLESLKQAHRVVEPVARVAVNVRGAANEGMARGCVLLSPDRWRLTDSVDVRVRPVQAPAMRAGTTPAQDLPIALILHIGTASVAVRIRPLDADIARVQLSRALPLRIGDRAILRDPARRSVVAGIQVLDVPRLR